MDCHIDTGEIRQYYMLEESVWLQIVPARDGMLCIPCVEKRLGRRLEPGDFSPAPINHIYAGYSPVIASRFYGLAE